jgi:hypothetical protein
MPASLATALVAVALARAGADSHWSWKPVAATAPPQVADDRWSRNEIDRFIRAGLADKGLEPSPEASRRTLLRRLSFDLTGLPPTAAQVAAFEQDTRPDAYERAVEELLASPAHGERWARHWMDVARYADSNGLDENTAFANAWRYRDWLVRAFNGNLPIDRFIRMQVAGDLLPDAQRAETAADSLTATGFLVLGPKVLAEPDKEKLVYDLVDEQVDVFSKAFLAESVSCARCHDHKFDPVSQADYFAIAGIFRSTDTMASVATVARALEREASPVDAAERRVRSHQRADSARAAYSAAEWQASAALQRALDHGTSPAVAMDPVARIEAAGLLAEAQAAEAARIPAEPFVLSVRDAAKPVDLALHVRGDHTKAPGPAIPRGVPAALSQGVAFGPIAGGASGRLALADWLTNPDHPLVARVFVNRVWHWHFGRGLVESPSDFGTRGGRPSHPELLDWLARDFVASGWDLRRLHRQIVTSAAYRQASAARADCMAIDPGNRSLWRWTPRRLEAEAIRDTVLAVSGSLDRTVGGTLLKTGNFDYVTNDQSANAAQYGAPRRSLYLPVIRNAIFPFFATFDYTDPSVSIDARPSTVIAPQALYMLNSPFVREEAKAWAARLREQVPVAPAAADAPVLASRSPDPAADRIRAAYRQAFGRSPSERELGAGSAFLASQASLGEDAAWAAYAQALLATSELVTID